MKHDKLVRDKIPEVIKKNGQIPITHIATDAEYQLRLHAKLQEEVDEFLENPSKKEIADILEVINALCDLHGFDKTEVEQIRIDKAKQRGAFKEKIVLDVTK